ESNALWLISMRITDKCNHRCEACGQYGEGGYNREDIDLPKVKGNVPIQRYMEMIDNIAHLKPHIYITGGEPFLYKGLVEFCNYIKEKGLTLQIVTNGVFLERYAEEIVENEWDMICPSLNGPEEIHDRWHKCDGAFGTMKRGVEKIQRIKEETGKKRPLIFLLNTLSATNYHYLVNTIEVAQEFNPDSVIIYYSWFTSHEVGIRHSKIIEDELGILPFSWKSYVRDNSDTDFDGLRNAVWDVQSRKWPNPTVFVPNIGIEEIETYYTEPTNFL
ncbi:unnamed protein product, partial [marine sediment metagenome]